MAWKLWAARWAVILILAGAAQPFYFRFLSPATRRSFGAWAARLPYSKTPGLYDFMTGVRARTEAGARIVILLPYRKWDGGYAYGYTRSTYLLAGRTTIPFVGADDRTHPLANPDYIAAWRVTTEAIDGFAPVWHDENGVLFRRTR